MKRYVLCVWFALTLAAACTSDPLPSWNEGPTKKAIGDFVERVTKEGSSDFVPAPERIATFDNDGTLWTEKPLPFQLLFALDRVKALAPHHAEWATKEPFASILKDDLAAVLAGGSKGLAEIIAVTHAGMTTDEFAPIVGQWITTAKHPQTGRLYTEMVYQPMIELLAYLRAKGFKTFIASGGGVEFMRAWTERVYGIPPEQVIGSVGKLKFEMREGTPVLIKLPEIEFIDDKEGKPIAVQSRIGRRPIAAFGNSDGDLQMLQWTMAGSGARFALFVHHDDPAREFAYDRTDKLQQFDKGWDEAVAKGWTVVSIKNDWRIVRSYAMVSATRNALVLNAVYPSREQVILNLMLNAFSAMSGKGLDGARRLIVRTNAIDRSNVLVEVQDSGTGIAAEKLESIFDPFVTSKPEGLGVGLSICRSIIERHRGKIWAANNPDRGAKFSITLPVTRE